MQFLVDFLPLLIFFGCYAAFDIFVATAAGIVASLAQLAYTRIRRGRFETTHIITAVIITVMGGLTLLLRDATFIKWKPTLVYWALALVMLGTQLFTERTALERLMGHQLALPERIWRRMSLAWVVFFLFCGALNIYVAFYYGTDLDEETRLDHWVNFKVFGMTALTLVFAVAQMFFVARHVEDESPEEN